MLTLLRRVHGARVLACASETGTQISREKTAQVLLRGKVNESFLGIILNKVEAR